MNATIPLVTSWLLVMPEAYQEEDAVVQLALHLCGSERRGSLGRDNRQPLIWLCEKLFRQKEAEGPRDASVAAEEAVRGVRAAHTLLAQRGGARARAITKASSRLPRARVSIMVPSGAPRKIIYPRVGSWDPQLVPKHNSRCSETNFWYESSSETRSSLQVDT